MFVIWVREIEEMLHFGDCQVLVHMFGIFTNEYKLSVLENHVELYNINASELDDSIVKPKIVHNSGYFFKTDEEQNIFTVLVKTKGQLFSGTIEVPSPEIFQIENLKLYSTELKVDDKLVTSCIYKVEYKGVEIQNLERNDEVLGMEFTVHGPETTEN